MKFNEITRVSSISGTKKSKTARNDSKMKMKFSKMKVLDSFLGNITSLGHIIININFLDFRVIYLLFCFFFRKYFFFSSKF